MRKIPFLQFSTIHNFLSKFPGFSNPEKHSLGFLNSTQFFGALNDNIYKLVLIFYLIHIKGEAYTNGILSAAGAIFVIPFLLFSSLAGILSDKYSKNRFIILVKTSEIITMILAILAFALKFTWSSYALLFLLSLHSAMFGPSKYGIIPELVPKNRVSKANGLITSFTYLAIIFGTFLAPFLTNITKENYVIVACFCLLFAVVGFVSSFGIKYTPPKGTEQKINLFFVQEIYRTFVNCANYKHIVVSIIASAYFLFIGAFMQLNIIPFAMQSLHLSDTAGGYLFLMCALGIAFGAVIAGKLTKKRIELGLTCLGGLIISLFFFTLSFAGTNLSLTVISLFLLGFAGGLFIVPVDSFIQLFSPEEIRGQVIATSNFSSFVGVLLASLSLYLFNAVFEFSAAQSFIIMGSLTFVFSLFLILRLSDLFFSYLARKLLFWIHPVKTENLKFVLKSEHPILMLEEGTVFKAWLLMGVLANIHLLIPQYKTRNFPWFENFFFSIHRIDSPQKFETLVNKSKDFAAKDKIPCIYLKKKKPVPEKEAFAILSTFKRKNYDVITVNFKKEANSKTITVEFTK